MPYTPIELAAFAADGASTKRMIETLERYIIDNKSPAKREDYIAKLYQLQNLAKLPAGTIDDLKRLAKKRSAMLSAGDMLPEVKQISQDIESIFQQEK